MLIKYSYSVLLQEEVFMNYKAVIAGSSGLVGGELLKKLLDNSEYDEVVVLVRKKLPLQHQKLQQVVVDFDRLADFENHIIGHALFCCLGTTRNKTPNLKDYRKIDHDYPVQLAKIAAKNSMSQCHIVSSLGANANSRIFYSKLKGETENDLKSLTFDSIHIYRPSLLTGKRPKKALSERFATFLFKIIDPFLIGKLRRFRSISAKTVAVAMVNQSIKNDFGIFIYPSDQIKKLAWAL